jgi:hypothetical protein
MSRYAHLRKLYPRLRRWRRIHGAFLVLLIGVLIVGIGAGIYIWKLTTKVDDAAVITPVIRDAAASTTVANNYFTFDSSVSWGLVTSESTPPYKYVYQNVDGGKLARTLTIYRQLVPTDLQVSYVVPVSVTNENALVPEAVSPRCVHPADAPAGPDVHAYHGVEFTCAVDVQEESIAAGHKDTGYTIEIPKPSGGTTKIGLYYHDVSTLPDQAIFTEIISNFRLL